MIDYAAVSHKGLVRDKNEDCYSVLPDLKGGYKAFVIADGMGGHNAGELASRMTVDYISKRLADTDMAGLESMPAWLEKTINDTNEHIYRTSSKPGDNLGMGTTLTLLVMNSDTIYIGHVGDSRVYLIRREEIRSLTTDHSFAGELERQGAISKIEAAAHPGRNVITRAIGVIPDVKADTYTYSVETGDILLMCTDGLTSVIPENEIKKVVSHENSAESACKKLIQMANQCGGEDNITVVEVKINQGA